MNRNTLRILVGVSQFSNIKRYFRIFRVVSSRECSFCLGGLSKNDMFCPEQNCGKIQAIDRGSNYFSLLGIPQAYDIDLINANKRFKEIMKKLHPDKFANLSPAELGIATQNSSILNGAIEVLSNPVQRAAYLLKLNGTNVLDGSTTMMDPELMMEIFELREKVELLENEKEKSALLNELNRVYNEIQNQLAAHFSAHDLTSAASFTVRLQYIQKVKQYN